LATAVAVAAQPAPNLLSRPKQAGKFLVFQLGNEEFGIEILKVREIIGLQEITPVPYTPDFVKGVLNLRGKMIPVADLRVKFGMEELGYVSRTCIIVVHLSGAEGPVPMGLVVDGVAEVIHVGESDVEETPEFGTQIDTSYLLGMAKVKGKVKMLVDIDRLFSTEDFPSLGQ
jgi:purine-binding chemotaxis protein CheW